MFENNEDEVHGALGRADIPAMISHTGFGSWPNGYQLSGLLSTSKTHQVMRKLARFPGPLQ